MNLAELFNTYSLQARLQPAILALLPRIESVAVWVSVLHDLSACCRRQVAGRKVGCDWWCQRVEVEAWTFDHMAVKQKQR